MVNELNTLILFGLAVLTVVAAVSLRMRFQRRLANYANVLKYADSKNLNIAHAHHVMPEQSALRRSSATDSVNIQETMQQKNIEGEKSESLFRSIFESAPECVILQNLDGSIELVNHTGLRLLEIDQTENVIGRSIYELIDEKYCDAYRAMSNTVFNGGKACLEYEMVTFKGNHRWMRTNTVPLRNAKQQITNLIATTRDITDTRLISQQLEAHRNKLQTIIESEPECVKLQDAGGIIMEMNPAGLSLLNAGKHDDVIGKTIYDFIMPEYTDQYRNLTAQVFNGGRGSMEFEVLCLKGRRRWLETHAAPLFDNAGSVSALLAITRDIDGRKKNEARLHQQQTELARVCRLSTMGEMASSLAHELNQPLCAVSSYAESARLLNMPTTKELNELLDKIVLQSRRATQIIKKTRDFVRKQTPSPESISAVSIIDSVIGFVEPDRRRDMISIDLQIAEDLPPVKADRVQIEQVLLNLISNAIQAVAELPYDQRKITVKASRESSEEIIFKVCNLGPDISEDIVKELFTPFYTTKATGMGMGLSISRSIVEAHGGSIWYRTKPGYGACFYFTLPVSSDA
jgi:two-component system sensor kinase FixL